MPANLPPEYFTAEKKYKEASSQGDKIIALEELIATIPKHKGTDKLRADFRKKLSKLRDEASRQKRSGKGDLYTVEREGAAQIALVGFANSGKSSILECLTNAQPVVADYPMSTVMPLSGMMRYEDIQFQLVDLPPVGNETTDGWVSGILRNADMLLIVIDLSDDPDTQAELIFDLISNWRIPLIKKDGTFEESEFVKSKQIIIVANKTDKDGAKEELADLEDNYGESFHLVPVSSLKREGVEVLRNEIFSVSGIIRAYSKEPGKDPDLNSPFTISYGSTVIDLGQLIHKDFVDNLKYACVWGSSKFPGQKVHKDHILKDKDIVEFHV
ncbi:MAG: 50S ribosome-binding GTPase [Nitrospirota bacterium]|nr:MAG: 50S ribosome-binding GTPase [Nitrospirota bacterium]